MNESDSDFSVWFIIISNILLIFLNYIDGAERNYIHETLKNSITTEILTNLKNNTNSKLFPRFRNYFFYKFSIELSKPQYNGHPTRGPHGELISYSMTNKSLNVFVTWACIVIQGKEFIRRECPEEYRRKDFPHVTDDDFYEMLRRFLREDFPEFLTEHEQEQNQQNSTSSNSSSRTTSSEGISNEIPILYSNSSKDLHRLL